MIKTELLIKPLLLLGGSIVDYLKTQGLSFDYKTRQAMARRFGISDYKGTAELNNRLMQLIKSNQEISPTTTMLGIAVTTPLEDGRAETVTHDITVKNPMYIDLSKYKQSTNPVSFKQAFAQARKGGLSEFEWNGGRYNTNIKSDQTADTVESALPVRLERVSNPINPTIVEDVDPALRSNTLESSKVLAEAAMEELAKESASVKLPWLRYYDSSTKTWYVNTPSRGSIKYTLGLGESKAVSYDAWKTLSTEDKNHLKTMGYHPDGVIGNLAYWLSGGSGEFSYTATPKTSQSSAPKTASKNLARPTGGQALGWRGIR